MTKTTRCDDAGSTIVDGVVVSMDDFDTLDIESYDPFEEFDFESDEDPLDDLIRELTTDAEGHTLWPEDADFLVIDGELTDQEHAEALTKRLAEDAEMATWAGYTREMVAADYAKVLAESAHGL